MMQFRELCVQNLNSKNASTGQYPIASCVIALKNKHISTNIISIIHNN